MSLMSWVLVMAWRRPGVPVRNQLINRCADGRAGQVSLRLLDAQGFGPVLVLNQAGVVMGAAHRDSLASAGDAKVGSVMRFGVSTVRPSEDAAALAHRMGHAEVTRVVVTRSDGTPVGLFFAADMPS